MNIILMRSAAGILTLCLVLSVNLDTLLAFPVPCKKMHVVKLVENEMKQLNNSLNVHHVQHNAEITHHLTIDDSIPLHKQNKSTACALDYMGKGLELIQDHQRKLINDKHMQKLFNDTITRVKKHTPSCLALTRCNNPKEPTFPNLNYKAKQWTRSFMEASLKFLKDLIFVLERSQKHDEQQ